MSEETGRGAEEPNRYGQGCWYEVWVDECVYCGRGDESRVRRYGPKPPPQDRYHYNQTACGHHFC